MQYVTSIERLARQEGIEQGVLQKAQESAIETLEVRFGAVPTSIVEAIDTIEAEDKLRSLFRQAIVIDSLEEFQILLNN